MNTPLVKHLLGAVRAAGVTEICLCPGGRNAPFVAYLSESSDFHVYNWFEERSAAFFAYGRSRALDTPMAVITTSGTAAAELLPAVMESYYAGVPLLCITADRPRRFRGTGAPQSAEQVGLFGKYTPFAEDLAAGETCNLTAWDRLSPAHLNVCFEEPLLGESS